MDAWQREFAADARWLPHLADIPADKLLLSRLDETLGWLSPSRPVSYPLSRHA